MAKIQSPSGETEFFQTTELQQAFEKELKTGEKVSIAPGVVEASFLREAPVRAEYQSAFDQFKERILNPYGPSQPRAFRYICEPFIQANSQSMQPIFTADPCAFPINPATPSLSQAFTYKFTSTLTPFLTPPTTSVPNIPYVIPITTNIPPQINASGWEANDIHPPAFGSITSTATLQPYIVPTTWVAPGLIYRGFEKPTPNVTGYTLPDWLNLDAYVENWLPIGGPSSTAVMSMGNILSQNIAITVTWQTNPVFAPLTYQVPSFNLTIPHTPSGTFRKIFELKADMVKQANNYPNSAGCYFNLTNFRFTNLYP
jgi:hypothetical protein